MTRRTLFTTVFWQQLKVNIMRTAMLLMLIIGTGLTSGVAIAAKDYYKWTDEEGVTHYSARKPHNRVSESISIRTGERTATPASSRSGNAEQARETASENTQTAENQGLVDPERCEAARDNLKVLRDNAKVRMQDENGEIHYLSEAEKAEKTQEFQQAVDESC